MTVLDLSNFDYPTFDAVAFKAAGVTDVIIGCQDEAMANAMAGACPPAGIRPIATYAFLYFGFDGFLGFEDLITLETNKAIRVALAHGVTWVALDVEADGVNETSNATPAMRIADLRKTIALVEAAGLRAFIYTGKWYWPIYMANTTEFSDLPLWHSEYPNDGHLIFAVDYGGWTAPHIHQYTSKLPVCGRGRDADYVITPLEADMTPEQSSKLDAVYAFVTGGATNPKGAQELTDWNAGGSSLLEGYMDLRQRVATLEAAPAPTAIANHTHTLSGSTGGPA